MDLDTRTLFLINVTNNFVAAGAILLAWYHGRHSLGLRIWSTGLALGGTGALLIGLRGTISDLLSVAVGNILVVAGFATTWLSIKRFNTARYELGIVSAVVMGFAVIFVGSWLAGADQATRVVIASIFVGGLAMMAAWEVLAGARVEPLRARRPMAIAFFVLAMIFVGRGVMTYVHGPGKSVEALERIQQAALFGSTMCIIAINLCLLTLANERLRNRFERLASTDELTGIFNRRSLMETGDRLCRRAAAGGTAACALMMDLDHFRSINRKYGHEGGDRALVAFAGFARDQLRPTDVFGRYGGEEFCALLVGADLAQAERVAERLRSGLADLPIDVGGRTFSITASIGVAPLIDGDFRAAVRDADAALYRAKELGRNRVVRSTDAQAPVQRAGKPEEAPSDQDFY